MSMIFDGFEHPGQAVLFAAAIQQMHGLEWQLFSSVEEAMQHDLFPGRLTAPVLHIDRADVEVEDAVARAAAEANVRFAGT